MLFCLPSKMFNFLVCSSYGDMMIHYLPNFSLKNLIKPFCLNNENDRMLYHQRFKLQFEQGKNF